MAATEGAADKIEEQPPASAKWGKAVCIAIDRSKQAEMAFDFYAANLHKAENKVILMHIPEGPTVYMSKAEHLPDGEIQKMKEKEKVETAELVNIYKKKLENYDMDVTYKTVYGKPGEAIVAASKELNAFLIIMGTRGMGTIRRTILGSVSDYVVHHAEMPVIICRH